MKAVTRNYVLLAVANTTSLMGNWVFKLVTIYLLWHMTKSAFVTSLMAVAEFVPNMLFGPIGGALADKVQLIRANTILNTLLAFNSFVVAGLLSLGLDDARVVQGLLILTAVNSGLGALNRSTNQKIVGFAFSKDEIKHALSINSLSFNMTKFMAPLLTGLVIYGQWYSFAYSFNALSFFAWVYSGYAYSYHRKPVHECEQRQSIWRDITGALSYVRRDQNLFFLLTMVVFATVFSRSIFDMLPVLTEYLMHTDSENFVYISASLGLFSIFAGLVNSRVSNGSIQMPLICSVIAMVLISANIFFSNFLAAIVLLGLGSFFFVLSGINTITYIHVNCDESQKGKVIGLYYLALTGGASIGMMLYGVFVELDVKLWIWCLSLIGLVCLLAYPKPANTLKEV
ncbi:MFS transporter [Vibrio profundum]|uniref:MFS transporter n=1 Tax=Vibrio profundum TaxID=2910247 RepID=UPI003D0A183C